jgi:hypothetical protein
MARCFFRFFSSSLFDILIAFEKFRYLICSYSIVICLHWRILHLLGHESFQLVPFFSPFVGCFVLLMISKFSSF